MAKKVFALCPDVRDQECNHPGGFPFVGRMPCTGAQLCPLCGSEWDARTSTILAPRFATLEG